MGLQRFKKHLADSVVNAQNASLDSMPASSSEKGSAAPTQPEWCGARRGGGWGEGRQARGPPARACAI